MDTENDNPAGLPPCEDARAGERELLDMLGRKSRLRAHAEKFPGCAECKRRIETGNYAGPGHEPSGLCRSGKRPHCSCDFCY